MILYEPINSHEPDERLASMVCEVHVIALPKSGIVQDLYDAEEYLNKVIRRRAAFTFQIRTVHVQHDCIGLRLFFLNVF